MQTQYLTLNEHHTVTAFLPDNINQTMPVWYTFLPDNGEGNALADLLPRHHALVVVHTQLAWEQVFSPWAAPRLSSKGEDFTGGAAAYYHTFCTQWIPQIEQQLAIPTPIRGLLGYSLAGLFAVYGATVTPYFPYVASVSGSLWFDGWVDFMAQYSPQQLPRAIYFSVGDKEARTRQTRMATVQTATEQTSAYWQQYGVPTTFELNAGGHFQDIPQRLAKAVAWFEQIKLN